MTPISRLALVLCLVAAPLAGALSSRRRVTPALPRNGQLHCRTATQLSTVTALRGGSLLSEHKLLSYMVYAVASAAAVGSGIALIGALLLLRWVQKPSLSESGLRSRRWKPQLVKDSQLAAARAAIHRPKGPPAYAGPPHESERCAVAALDAEERLRWCSGAHHHHHHRAFGHAGASSRTRLASRARTRQ